MYKDKDKQREANRQAQARFKAKAKVLPTDGITGGITDTERRYCNKGEGMTDEGVTITKADRHIDASDIGMVKAIHQAISKPKRGKDIKCFEDLPTDVQQTIDRMSMVDGKPDKDEKAKRTAAAIKYQHLFPDKYEPTDAVCTGVVTGKPGDADYNGVCTEAWRAERGR